MIKVFELLSKIFSITISQHSCNFRNSVLLGGQQFKCPAHFERIDSRPLECAFTPNNQHINI